MKISIWRQFSSNNSSSYVIVGAFETPEKAHEAAEKFKALLRRIWEWYKAHPDIREAVLNEERHEFTDIEREIVSEYNIEFEQPTETWAQGVDELAIEWVAREGSLDFLPDAVSVFENHVFVAPVDETVTPDSLLAQYMHRLGADMKYEQAMGYPPTVNVSGEAPDAATAQLIKSSAETYFALAWDDVNHSPPWASFYEGELAPNPERLKRDLDMLVTEEIERRALTSPLKWSLAHEVTQRMIRIEWWLHIESDKPVTVVGNSVKFSSLYFHTDGLGHGLPALVTWMRALGCTNVAYEFVLAGPDG